MMKRWVILLITFVVFGFGLLNAQDVKDGYSRTTQEDGSVYEGEFKDGLFDGQGILTYVNGDRYEGQFSEGKFEGQGKA